MSTRTRTSTAAEPGTGEAVHHAANVVVLAPDAAGVMCVLLAQRDREPDVGSWGLPGGVCQPGDAPIAVAVRRCQEKTGVDVDGHELVHVSSRDEGRDEAGRYVTVSFVVMLPRPISAGIGDMVRQVRWWSLAEAMEQPLAFDHGEILREAVDVAELVEGAGRGH